MAQAPRTPTADESSKNGKRSSRSISTFAQNSSNSNEFKAVLRASRTFSHSSPLISIGNCRARAANQQETDGEVIDSSLKDPIKSECFQWGCGKKILEKPKLLRGKNIKTVQSGGSHTIALLEDGTVYTWGDGRCGQLGLGKDINHTEQPKRIEDFEEEVAEIYAGFTQSAVITKSGRLYVCGLIAEDMRWTLENIPSFDNVKILSIAFGPSCIAVLGSTIRVDLLKNTTSLGPSTIWVWGHSRKGHLGMGDRRNILEPCELESLSQCNVTQISSGEHHMGAVTADHRVFIWGDGPVNGMEGPFNEPTEVLGLEMKGAIKVVCGNRNTFVLTADGSVYSWGLGRYGALGHGNTESYEFPGKINSFHDKKIVGIDSGGNHACAWTADGRVYSWGSGRNFALGHSDGEDRLVPHLIEALADGKILLQLSCGSSDTVVLVERDIIAVEYRGQINRLPVHNYPFVGHVIRKLATHHNKRVEDLFLLDHSNTPLKVGDAIRDLKMVCRQGLTLVSKPSMYDYECESLILFPPDAERIKKGCDAIPVVKGGTIPKLIEWLTFPQSCGHEFVSTFLLTYRTFMTSEELIEQLIKRYENPIFPIDEFDSYNIPDYTPQSDDAKRHIIRIRVLNVIKKWLTSYADNFIGYNPAPVIQMIHKFLKSDKTVQQKFERESANIMRVCEQLKNKEDTSGEEHEIPTRAPECPPICEPFHNGPWDIFKYPPEEMARQITIIDYFYYFRKIQPGELIGQAWSKAKKEDQAPNLLRMIHRFNNVSEWVVRVILTGKTQVIRSLCTERMIDIADELFKLNSFNAVMSILSAFSQSSLYRLKSVFEPKNGGISGAALEKLNKLRKIFKVENNMIPYRDLFASLPPPKIPFMGKYLQDLTFIDENPDYLDKEHNIVNFDKRTRLASIISLIQRLQKASYSFTEIPECIEALQNISGFGEDHERTTFKVSKFIEQKTGEVTNDISEIDDPRIREMIHEVTPPVPLSLRRRNLTVLSRTLSTSDYVQ